MQNLLARCLVSLALLTIVGLGAGCDTPAASNPSGIGDRQLTPTGQRFRDYPAESTDVLEEIAARGGEPNDQDLFLAVVSVAVLVDAEETGRLHPLFADAAFQRDMSALADRYPELFEPSSETGSTAAPLVTGPDQRTFECGPEACDLDRTTLAPAAFGALVGIAGLPPVASNPVIREIINNLSALVNAYDLGTLASTLSFDRATWRDAAVAIGTFALGVTAATAGGLLATIAAVGGAAIAVAQLASQYDLLMNAQRRCLAFQRSGCGGVDAGTVDSGTVDSGPGDAGPCPGSPTAIVCGDPPICLEPASNHMHCGGCDNPCSSGVCTDGICECPTAGEIECAGACLDPMTDRANCGRCGNACRSGRTCAAGRCQEPCGDGVCEMGEWSRNCAVDCGAATDCEQPGRFKVVGDWVLDELQSVWWQRGDSGPIEMETVTRNLGTGHVAYCASLGARVPNFALLLNLAFGFDGCTSRPISLDPVAFPAASDLPYLTDDVCMDWPATRRSAVEFTPDALVCPRFTDGPFRVRCVRDTAP